MQKDEVPPEIRKILDEGREILEDMLEHVPEFAESLSPTDFWDNGFLNGYMSCLKMVNDRVDAHITANRFIEGLRRKPPGS